MAQAIDALRTSAASPGEVTGALRLTVPALALPFVVTPVVPQLLARHPRIDLEVIVEDRLIDIVAEGRDAGIRFTDSIERIGAYAPQARSADADLGGHEVA